MKLIIFIVVLATDILGLVGLIINLRFPETRIWPPPRKRSWQFQLVWILATVGMVGVPVVGILDWGTLGLDHSSRYLIGGALLLFAVPFALWAIGTLSLRQSLGLKGKLLTKGPYRYTRNPQYVANILVFVGVILITNSLMALMTGVLQMLWFVLAPFSEEHWLQQQFGKQYEEYCKNVPRFVGFRSFQSRSKRRTENVLA